MTIQEAIETGKPFRRKSWGDIWQEVTEDKMFRYSRNNTTLLDADDILAEDWEVKQ